jgi:hypothetical protein
MLVGALEGEMLVARAYGDPARFESAARLLLTQLAGSKASAADTRRARKPARRAQERLPSARLKGPRAQRARTR